MDVMNLRQKLPNAVCHESRDALRTRGKTPQNVHAVIALFIAMTFPHQTWVTGGADTPHTNEIGNFDLRQHDTSINYTHAQHDACRKDIQMRFSQQMSHWTSQVKQASGVVVAGGVRRVRTQAN